MSLSILIMSLEERLPLLKQLGEELKFQIRTECAKVEIVIETDDGTEPYASKYRRGLSRCQGDYVCSLDDDDYISGNYIKCINQGLALTPDVVTFGLLRCDLGEVWTFKTNVKDWSPSLGGYMMMANQLCAWKREVLLQVPMMDLPYGSDVPYCHLLNLHKQHIVEVHIPRVLYLYRYNQSFTRRQQHEHYREAREKTAGGIDGWQHKKTGHLFLSEAALNFESYEMVRVRNVHGELTAYPKSDLWHLFRVNI